MTPRRRDFRLGFVSGRFVSLEPDGLYSDAPLGRLIDALGARVEHLSVSLSLEPFRRPLDDHRMSMEPADLIPLPWMPSVQAGFHSVAPAVRALREVRRRSDVVVIQLPFTAPLALPADRGPTVYHVCADQRAIVRTSRVRKGLERLAAVGVADATDLLHRALVRRDRRIVTHGDELLLRYGGREHGRSVVSSTLSEVELGSATRVRAHDGAFRVLFVGYLRPEKGLDVLVEAMGALRTRVPDTELHLLGPYDERDSGLQKLLDEARRALAGRVSVLGERSYGPQLFQAYADADVLALPSRSEGTPRVLVEARAFGCPVVASRVGGIPFSVEHEHDGLLVDPADPQKLADALVRVAQDVGLRSRLVTAGLERARRSTVEAFAEQILDEAEIALHRSHLGGSVWDRRNRDEHEASSPKLRPADRSLTR